MSYFVHRYAMQFKFEDEIPDKSGNVGNVFEYNSSCSPINNNGGKIKRIW